MFNWWIPSNLPFPYYSVLCSSILSWSPRTNVPPYCLMIAFILKLWYPLTHPLSLRSRTLLRSPYTVLCFLVPLCSQSVFFFAKLARTPYPYVSYSLIPLTLILSNSLMFSNPLQRPLPLYMLSNPYMRPLSLCSHNLLCSPTLTCAPHPYALITFHAPLPLHAPLTLMLS